MIAESVLSQNLCGDLIRPQFLGPEDLSWLESLRDEFMRFEGRPRRELLARAKEPWLFKAPEVKLKLAVAVMLKRATTQDIDINRARHLRGELFRMGASELSREAALEKVALKEGLSIEQLLRDLFSDLKDERRLEDTSWRDLQAHTLALDCNLLLTKAFLARAREVSLKILGNCRAIIRHAKFRGLICVVEKLESKEELLHLNISGPFAIFRHTQVYGKRLGELPRLLKNCHRFELEARVVVRDRERTFRLGSEAPLPCASTIKKFDSQLERRFAREFGKATSDWDLIREPEPLELEGRWLFPDFEIRHRHLPERRWLLEIAGFWHPEYIKTKVIAYREAARVFPDLKIILCVDRKSFCGQEDSLTVSKAGEVIEFTGRLDPKQVLMVIERRRNGDMGLGRSQN
ncbi:MAG: hypothetical protein C5B49_03420 [Bdellovibrio sp.]|nr:MAG: hypothetical protein C5B49_03420 [Bdellovibrio sp.]